MLHKSALYAVKRTDSRTMQKSLPDDRASHSEYAVKAEKQPRTEPTLFFSIFYAVFAPFIVSNTLRYLTCETRM